MSRDEARFPGGDDDVVELYPDPEFSSEQKRTEAGTTTIAVASIKGGQGTTQSAVNLAATLSLTGKKTTLVDLSFGSRSASTYLGSPPARYTLAGAEPANIRSNDRHFMPHAYSFVTRPVARR